MVPIIQYSIGGEYQETYLSVEVAANILNLHKDEIKKCLEGLQFSTGEYRWGYDINQQKFSKISQFEYQNERKGEFIKEYNSIQEISELLKINSSIVVKTIAYQTPLNGYIYDWTDGGIRPRYIVQYNGSVPVNSFSSEKLAAKQMKCEVKCIKNALLSGKECFGFKWFYEFEGIRTIQKIPVYYQYTLTGNKLNTYTTTDIIYKYLNIKKEALYKAIRNKKPIQGYLFRKDLVSSHDYTIKFERFTVKNIKRYTLSGQYIKRYFTVDTAINEEQLSRKELINSIINRTPYLDSLWCYDGEEHDLPFRILRRYDKDGIKIEEFNTIKEAVEKTGIPEHKIKRALKEERYTCKTFWVWEKPDFKLEENSKFVGPPRVAVETIKPPRVRLSYGPR